MNVILMGPPGSGKGTQAAVLAWFQDLRHVSTGDMLRAAVASGSALGKRVEGIMAAGELVPDDVMMEIVKERLEELGEGWVLDGFPRTAEQVAGLVELLDGLGQEVGLVVDLQVPDEEIVRRLAGRVTCGDCGHTTSRDALDPDGGCPDCGGRTLHVRVDDAEETVRRRLDVYRATTGPVAEALGRRYPLRRVEGVGAPDAVAQRIASALEAADQA